ncbi:MAG: chemotaxis protein CheD [Thermoanaerobaculia bacterium]|jgi:chemotaxis protein CheD|nr:chemotaxis protein CheD [Thermoanaerobaculia bacterium]
MSALHNVQHQTLAADTEAMRRVYLYPGQIVTSGQPLMVSTILGSCVSISMWDPSTLIGGINHYLLPNNPVPGQSDLRYGNTAIERLIEQLAGLGVKKQRIVAKVIGGASVLTSFSGSRQSIGDQNVAVARQLLAKHGIEISAEQTGGTRGRKLLFHTGNGSVFSKEI